MSSTALENVLLSLREFRRSYFLGLGASDLCGFVKQPSFDNFYQSRPPMAPHPAQHGTNLAQGEWNRVPESQQIYIKKRRKCKQLKQEQHLCLECVGDFLKKRSAQRLGFYRGFMNKVINMLYKT